MIRNTIHHQDEMDNDIEFVVNVMRANSKPKFVRANKNKLDKFIDSDVDWSGYVDLAKKPKIGTNSYNVVLVEMTPQLQRLLTLIYKGDTNEKKLHSNREGNNA